MWWWWCSSESRITSFSHSFAKGMKGGFIRGSLIPLKQYQEILVVFLRTTDDLPPADEAKEREEEEGKGHFLQL